MYNYIKSPINGDIFPITSKSAKLIIKKSLLNELYLIINNNIKINLDIQTKY